MDLWEPMEGAQLQEGYNAALAWFTQFQLPYIFKDGAVPEWFHGLISRKTAEDLLLSKPVGHFLIRVSQSRKGYTLSFRGEECCHHFMIDILKDGQYNIIGEKIHHRSLQDLVEFHRRVPILPFNDLLTVACRKSEQAIDSLLPTQVSSSFPEPKSCPPSSGCDAVPAPSGLPRLYPCLETEVAAMNLQSSNLGDTGNPTILPKKPLASISSQPPELPPRSILSQRRVETSTGDIIPPEPNSTSVEAPTAHSSQQSGFSAPQQKRNKGIINIINFKKKLHPKRSNSEDHMYSEILMPHKIIPDWLLLPAQKHNNGVAKTCTENACQEMQEGHAVPEASRDAVQTPDLNIFSAGQKLPAEYLHPPPFAPGY
ncbi:hypothetical protein GN956_G2326 [Arapaima gigas]